LSVDVEKNSQELVDNLKLILIKHEGMKLTPYLCPAGKLTIGCGRNLDDVGISNDEALLLLANDVKGTLRQTEYFPWFKGLNQPRQIVIASMLFNLGFSKFLEFKKLLAALKQNDFDKAANEMLASMWAGQVGKRATELATIMKTGVMA
jgi:lysozyme